MTLCICWRTNGVVQFAADSRLNFTGSNTPVDLGAKIVRIISRIRPANGLPDKQYPSYELQLGLAYAGGALTALTLVEGLRHLLSRLQYGPGLIDPSLDSLAITVTKFFSSVSASFGRVLCKDSITTFALGGRCPVKDCVRVFRFELVPAGDHMQATFVEEELTTPLLLGSGSSAAQRQLDAGACPLDTLKAVIEDDAVRTVGGTVQYGSFRRGFTLYAVQDYILDELAKEIHIGFFFRGIPLLAAEPPEFTGGLAVAQKIILPFQRQIDEHLRAGFVQVNV